MSLAVQLTSSLSIGNRLLQLSRAVKQLFAAGEQGAWYDPSDFSTLFQDSAGTTPVTATGQSVGLMLDKSKGLVLGPEMVTNGTFDTADGWTLGADWSISGGALRKGTTGVADQVIPVTFIVGSSYKITGTGLSGNLHHGSVYQGCQSGTIFTPTSSVVSFQGGGPYTFDNISIRELPGNHATQATAANRPVLRQDGNGCYYLAFNGTNSAMATGSVNFTATDKMTVFAGVRKLSDAAQGVVTELSATIATNAGSFLLTAPNSAAGNLNFSSKGTTQQDNTVATYTAPITNVITGLSSISGPSNLIKVNGGTATTVSASQGTGNFGNYPLYIGARASTSLFFNGNLYSLIVRGAQSSAAQISSGEAYVNGKTKAY